MNIIAIKSCYRDCSNGFNQAIRDTWLKDCPLDYRFFVGRGEGTLLSDEEPLDCGDTYLDLPLKTCAIFQWVLTRDYGHAFLADTDTYVNIPKLLTSGYENYDLLGSFNGRVGVPGAVNGKYAWVSGGAGYWVSRRAMEIVTAAKPDLWAEDLWVSQVLGEAAYKGYIRAWTHRGYGQDNEITSHYSSIGWNRTFDPSWMYQKHRENR